MTDSVKSFCLEQGLCLYRLLHKTFATVAAIDAGMDFMALLD